MKRSATVATLALSAALGLATLTGCGAGQIAQTDTQAPGVGGYQAQAGTVLVRDASIAYSGQMTTGATYRAGQNASLQMTLVNIGTVPDKLVSVSSPIASSAQIQGDATIPPGGTVRVGNGNTPESAALSTKTIQITLVGLTKDLTAGLDYPVTLTFEHGGVVNAELPIGPPSGDLAARTRSN